MAAADAIASNSGVLGISSSLSEESSTISGVGGVMVMAGIFKLCGSDALRFCGVASVCGALLSVGMLALIFALLDL